MTEDHHLDDEQLSAALDGEGEAETASHLRACAACAARLDGLRRAVALIGEPVPPPSAVLVDRAVGAALQGTTGAEPTTPAAVPIRRRYLTPPLSWAAAAAAAIAVLVGIAALVGTTGDDGSDMAARPAPEGHLEADEAHDAPGRAAPVDQDAQSFAAEGTASSGSSTAGEGLEDLGAHDDPDALAAAVRARVEAIPRRAERSSDDEASEITCRREAEAVGGGRLGPLVHAATAQWKGEPAYVLTFSLSEEDGGDAGHQVYVMSSSRCSLLAEARF